MKITQYSRMQHHTIYGSSFDGATFSIPYQEDFTVLGVATFSWANTDLALSEIGVNEYNEFASIRIGGDILNIGLFVNFIPTATDDTRGYIGQMSYDNGYFYIKTPTGWKKSTLNTF